MTVLNLQVSASADDAYQKGTVVNISAAYVEAGDESGSDLLTGFRFLAVNVAQGTTLTSATFTVTSHDTYDGPAGLVVSAKCENSDDAAAFTTAANNISARALTSGASFDINNVTLDVEYSVTITTPVQAVINRAGFVANNDIAVILDGAGVPTDEWQNFWAYNGSTTKAAKLDIVYTAGGASYNESGSGVSGVVSAGTERAAYVTTGAGITGDVALVSDAMTARETGPGIAGTVAVGADAKSAAESGAGIASATASGADRLTWTETAAGIAGPFAAGADVAALIDSGYGLADAISSGAETYSGGGASYNETGTGAAGGEAYAVDVAALIDSGYSLAGLIPLGADALAYVETGAGIIGSSESGNDGYTAGDCGAGIISAIASALDVVAILDGGYGLAGAVASVSDSFSTSGAASKVDYTRQSGQDVAQAQPGARAQGQRTAQNTQAARGRGSKVG